MRFSIEMYLRNTISASCDSTTSSYARSEMIEINRANPCGGQKSVASVPAITTG